MCFCITLCPILQSDQMNATLCVHCTDVADVARVSQCLCYCTRITRITVAFAFSQSFLPVRLHGSCHRHSCHRRLHAYLLGYRILLRSTKQSKCTRSHHMCACVIKLKRRKLACPVDGRTVPPHACSYTDCGAMCAHQFIRPTVPRLPVRPSVSLLVIAVHEHVCTSRWLHRAAYRSEYE